MHGSPAQQSSIHHFLLRVAVRGQCGGVQLQAKGGLLKVVVLLLLGHKLAVAWS